MIGVTELRAGTVFEDQGNIFVVLSYEHIKMGRGSATIRVKVRNIKTGNSLEKSFINGAKVNPIQVLKKDMQFLYKDADNAYFMNPKTYEQIAIPLKAIDPEHLYLKEGQEFNISFIDDEPLSLNLPPKIDLEVTETGPGVKGNSATNSFKDAILENGIRTKVPLFIKIGNKVKIDTRTGAYTEKA
ncbi:elongation factor P [Patescibacteria group bacterium]|nr:elongation factor P [Patescibacteria group bacterium]